LARITHMPRRPQQAIDLEPLQLWEYTAIVPKLPYHWRLVYAILWESGIRIGEALRLTKKDLTQERCNKCLGTGRVSPQFAICSDCRGTGIAGGIWVNRLKKRKKPQRDFIPLPPSLVAALHTYAALLPGQKLFPYTTAGAWKALKVASAAGGVRRTIHPHLFRHGFTRTVAKRDLGLSPLDHMTLLARMLGHSSIKQVESYFMPGMQEAADTFRRMQGR